MDDVLTDFSESALVNAIKTNLFELFRHVGRSPNVEFFEGPQVTWCITGIPDAFANAVFRTQLGADNADEVIKETVKSFKASGMPMAWYIERDATPTDLADRLGQHGFIYDEGPPGMAVDLLKLDESSPLPPGMTIERVTDLVTLRKWSHVAEKGFGLPDNFQDTIYNMNAGVALDEKSPWRLSMGLIDGEPIASVGMLLKAGVSGIYFVSTVPEARGRGIGRAITLAPLIESRDMGYRIGILHSSAMGFNVYKTLGFKKYCDLEFYVWRGETS